MLKENSFRQWLDSIPTGEYPEIRKRILNDCIIKDYVFKNWRNGITKIPPLAKEKINSIANKNIFDNE